MNCLYWFRNFSIALLISFPTMLLHAADEVELNPGTIEGNVQLGSETINSLQMVASSGPFSATQSLSPNSVEASYELTVQVEAGLSREYQVSADIRTDNSRDRLLISGNSVIVTDGEVASLDIIVNAVAYIEGTITVEGEAIQWVSLSANQTATPFDYANTYHQATGGPESLDIRFPIMPGQEVRCSGSVRLTNGVNISLPAKLVVPSADAPARCDYLIEAGPAPGTISGILDLDGAEAVDRYYLSFSGPIGKSPFFDRPFDTPEGGGDNSHNYDVELIPGTYSLNVTTALNNNDDTLTFPEDAFNPGRSGLELVSEQNTELYIEACQAYINGSLQFTGSASMADLSFGHAIARGDFSIDSPTRNGISWDRMTPASGAFDLIVTDGDWSVSQFYNLRLYRGIDDPEGFLNEQIYLYMGSAQLDMVNLSCGETVERNISIPTGSVTFNLTVAENGVLSHPRLSFSCAKRDDTNQVLYNYSGSSSTQGQVDVELGTVTFEGPAGICNSVRATALVNGSNTTFASLSNLEILPGVDVIIDIGGPSLEVTFPEPEQILNSNEVTIEGLVTDDVDVVSVTVNGVEAALATTNNPDDLVELSFEVTISLEAGANEIEIIATDGSGKTGQTNFTIYSDAGAPEVSFIPEDGASVGEAEQTVQGSATDDAGIDSVVISLNGSEIVTLEGEGALSVDFDQEITLDSGENAITVEATDINGQVATSVHKVILADNSAPTVSAGGPYSVNEGGSVQLSASGSDPELELLTYAWDLDGDGEFNDATTEKVTFDASAQDGPSSKPVAVQVTDMGGLTATDSTVVDIKNVAPSATDSVTVPTEPAPIEAEFDVSVPFADPAAADTHTVVWDWGDGSSGSGTISDGRASGSHSYSEQGFYHITCTITDDDGASSDNCQAAADVTVIDRNDGFVTGGGWIESPQGAYLPDPSLSGKVRFGFVTKYSKQELEPKGNIEIQFKVGDINFHASNFRWLVVTDSESIAHVRGVGTVNQSGDYEFVLTAIDGKQAGGEDKLRIQIWDEQKALMYDNLVGEVNGGSIVIHKVGKNKGSVASASSIRAKSPALAPETENESNGGSTGLFLLLLGIFGITTRRCE